MSPSAANDGFFVDFGWSISRDEKLAVPDGETAWSADRPSLTPGKPVTLNWSNGTGLRFRRVYSVDEDYLFTVIQRVYNDGKSPVTLYPWGRVSRNGTEVHGGTDAPMAGTYIHIGPVGVLDDPGEADLTAHVDFAALAHAARHAGAQSFGPVAQGDFLTGLGIAARMERARAEISHWDAYDYVVINENVNACFAKVREILDAERMKRQRQTGLIPFVRELMN